VKAKSIMLNNIRACSHLSSENRIERIEMPLARLILTVSHLDEEWDLEGMKVRARYVFFFSTFFTFSSFLTFLFGKRRLS
jgi:sister-chromatid-cohesion protein PDS5